MRYYISIILSFLVEYVIFLVESMTMGRLQGFGVACVVCGVQVPLGVAAEGPRTQTCPRWKWAKGAAAFSIE